MGIFVNYQEEHKLALNQLRDEFKDNISQIGATLQMQQIENT